jgi:hypothetical protein
MERLDPPTFAAGSSPADAKGRAPLVDFCNRNDPRARPSTNRPNPAHRTGGRPLAQLFPRVATLGPVTSSLSGAASGARPAERSRARDRGAVALASAFARLLPSRSLATGASPQPDRLGHLLSQARDVAGWSHPRRRAAGFSTGHFAELARRSPLTRRSPPRAASHVFPQRTTRSATPEVPSIAGSAPSGAGPSPPQSVPSLWSDRASASSIFVRPQP